MKTLFEKQHMRFTRNNGSTLTIKKDGFSYEDSKNENKNLNISFDNISYILALRYCNSNSSYNLIFVNKDKSPQIDFTTDPTIINDRHNILETKSILIAYAASKLTKNFPNNIDSLDIDLAHTLREKTIHISNGVIFGAKHSININEIRRVQCFTNGTISDLLIYKSEKKTFWNFPDMKIPCNEVTLPLIECIVTRNTGKGIDFSRGNGFDQENSEFIIKRYMDSSIFINEDDTFSEEWQKQVYERIKSYYHDLTNISKF